MQVVTSHSHQLINSTNHSDDGPKCLQSCREKGKTVSMIRSSFLRAPLLVRPALRSTSVGRAVLSLQNYSRTPSWSSTFRLSSIAVAVPAEHKLASLTPSQHDLPDTASNPPLKSSIQDRLPSWLRPYQVEVIEACVDALDRGLQRIGVSSPTGSGKTVML